MLHVVILPVVLKNGCLKKIYDALREDERFLRGGIVFAAWLEIRSVCFSLLLEGCVTLLSAMIVVLFSSSLCCDSSCIKGVHKR